MAAISAAIDGGAAEFYVTTTGSPKGNSSLAHPWDLATALVAVEYVKPGDTVWIHEGTYRGGLVSRLSGFPDASVVVRGEQAVLTVSEVLKRFVLWWMAERCAGRSTVIEIPGDHHLS